MRKAEGVISTQVACFKIVTSRFLKFGCQLVTRCLRLIRLKQRHITKPACQLTIIQGITKLAPSGVAIRAAQHFRGGWRREVWRQNRVSAITRRRAGVAGIAAGLSRRASGVPLRLAAGLRCRGRSRAIPNGANKGGLPSRCARRLWRAGASGRSSGAR